MFVQQAAQKNEFCFFLVFFKWILEKKLESTSIFRKFITSFVTRFFQNKTQQKTKPHLDFELFYFGLLFSCFFLVFFDRVVSFAGPPFFFWNLGSSCLPRRLLLKWQGWKWQSWRTIIRIVVMCHTARPCVTTKGVGDTTWVRKAACGCYIQDQWV